MDDGDRSARGVVLASSAAETDSLLDKFETVMKKEEPLVIGLDCEWVPDDFSFNSENLKVENEVLRTNVYLKRVCLIQLAAKCGLVGLIRLCMLGKMPDKLLSLLEREDVLKVGVGIAADSNRLRKDWEVNVVNFLDLRFLYKTALENGKVEQEEAAKTDFPSCKGLGLENLAKYLLGIANFKSAKITRSNWGALVLSDAQISYAAKDAQLSLDIFWKLTQLITSNQKVKFTDFEEFLNRDFKRRKVGTNAKTPKRNKQYTVYLPRAKVYENFELQAPDGERLTFISKKKLDWYLRQELVEIVAQDEEGNARAVRMKQDPSNRPVGTQMYYAMPKENQCVVCGHKESLLRKHVVPRQYRRHFPDFMKSHRSHDVLLLCLNCHEKAAILDRHFSEKLSIDYSAPLRREGCQVHLEKGLVVKYAQALLRNRHTNTIPTERCEALRQHIATYFGLDSSGLDDQMIEKAVALPTKLPIKDTQTHSEKVIAEVRAKPGGLVAFERSCREYFVEKMKPRYLPQMWSLKHNYEMYNIDNETDKSFEEGEANCF